MLKYKQKKHTTTYAEVKEKIIQENDCVILNWNDNITV